MKWHYWCFIVFAFFYCESLLAGNTYYPPERIICGLTQKNQLLCKDFNRDFLVESSSNATLSASEEQTFHFITAVAYVTTMGNAIFCSYADQNGKLVKLKTVHAEIKPDLIGENSWVKINKDIYTCEAGYRNCPMTF